MYICECVCPFFNYFSCECQNVNSLYTSSNGRMCEWTVRLNWMVKGQSHVKLVTIGVLQTRGACHLGADHGDTHGRGRRRGQQARLHPCKWCTARTVLPNVSFCLSLSFLCTALMWLLPVLPTDRGDFLQSTWNH